MLKRNDWDCDAEISESVLLKSCSTQAGNDID